jgi:hypothetical protein
MNFWWVIDQEMDKEPSIPVPVHSRTLLVQSSEELVSGDVKMPGAQSFVVPFEYVSGHIPRSYEGRDLSWKSSACFSNTSKGLGKSMRYLEELALW